MELKDKELICGKCGNAFIFTVKGQEFFLSKGFYDPRTCKECRLKKQDQKPKAKGYIGHGIYEFNGDKNGE